MECNGHYSQVKQKSTHPLSSNQRRIRPHPCRSPPRYDTQIRGLRLQDYEMCENFMQVAGRSQEILIQEINLNLQEKKRDFPKVFI